MAETALVILNHTLMDLVSVSIVYLLLSEVFRRNGAPVLWYAYFLVKAIVDIMIQHPGVHGVLAESLRSFSWLWFAFTSIASFVVICLSFKSDYVLVCVCAVLCDPLVSAMVASGWVVANAVYGNVNDVGFYVLLGPRTFISLAVTVVLYLVLRVPATRLLKAVCRNVLRHRTLWGVCAVFMAVLFTLGSHTQDSYESLTLYLSNAIVTFSIILAGIAFMLLKQGRDLSRRKEILQTCLDASQRYDETVRGQLTQLEQDFLALGGHEAVLERLRTREEGYTGERIAQLEQTYQHMRAGSFCNRPALDAVLSAAQHRLSQVGIVSNITVAGVPSSVAVPVMTVLAVANLAYEAAKRAPRHGDNHVVLRIRGIGKQVLIRLEVPAEWGTLWARRYLPALDNQGSGLVREKREGTRRVVLVVCEGGSS